MSWKNLSRVFVSSLVSSFVVFSLFSLTVPPPVLAQAENQSFFGKVLEFVFGAPGGNSKSVETPSPSLSSPQSSPSPQPSSSPASSTSSTLSTLTTFVRELADNVVTSRNILGETITTRNLTKNLLFLDEYFIDLSGVDVSGNTEGLKLPQSNDCSKGTDEGIVCWDRDDNVLSIGNGGNVSQFYGFGPAIDSSEITNGTVSFDDLANSSTLDATTTWALSTNNLIINLDSTGDFILQDNGTAFATFADDGSTTFANDIAVNGGDITTTATTWNFDVGGGGTIRFRDGTNTLASIVDQGAYGTLRLTDKGSTGDPSTCTAGDIYFNATDATFKGCSASNTWEVLDNASSSGTTILKRVSAAQTATTCATSDTNLTGGTYTLPANTLSTNGGLRIYAIVESTTVGFADSLTVKVDFGGTDIVSAAGSTARGFKPFESIIYNRNSASSQVSTSETVQVGSWLTDDAVTTNLYRPSVFKTASVNTAVDVTIAVQCLDADSGSGGDDDTVTLHMLLIEQLGSGS